MTTRGKVWGVTETLLKKTNLHIEGLTIEPFKRCSMHKHERKWNGFYVAQGRLLIEVRSSSYNLVDVTELTPGMFTAVAPGEFHRFVTESEGATGIELYWPDDLSDDIVREDVGGETRKPEPGPVKTLRLDDLMIGRDERGTMSNDQARALGEMRGETK